MSSTFPCPNCRKPVPDDAVACPHCKFYFGPVSASALDADEPADSGTFPCPNCGKPVPDEAEHCPSCKFSFGPAEGTVPAPAKRPTGGTVPCPNCGKAVREHDETCPHCRYRFGPDESLPPPKPKPEEQIEVATGPEKDAWGGRMDAVIDRTFDLQREKERIAGEGGPDWSEVDRFMGVDTSGEVTIVRDAPPAGGLSRILAWLMDMVVAQLPVLLYWVLATYLLHSAEEEIQFFCTVGAVVCYLVLFFLFNVRVHRTRGQTPGMRLIGIEVVRLDGTFVTAGQAFARACLVMVAPLWILTIPFDIQKRGIHDLMCGTRVIRS